MKRNCDMVRDLMPLCIDGAASEESQQVVAEHVAECKSCQQIYQDMQGSLACRAGSWCGSCLQRTNDPAHPQKAA